MDINYEIETARRSAIQAWSAYHAGTTSLREAQAASRRHRLLECAERALLADEAKALCALAYAQGGAR